MNFDWQLIIEHFQWISLGLGTATLLLMIVFATIVLRRQTRVKKVLDDLKQQGRNLSRLEVEIRELREAREVEPTAPRAAVPAAELKASPDSGLEKKHRVVSLAQKGLTSEDIARQLNIYKGEAELVLSLSKYFSHQPQEDQDAFVQ